MPFDDHDNQDYLPPESLLDDIDAHLNDECLIDDDESEEPVDPFTPNGTGDAELKEVLKGPTSVNLEDLPINESWTTLQFIQSRGLEKKLADIALGETKVPTGLRDDARQEILMLWASNKPNWKYQKTQIIAYAYTMAKNACRALMRELSAQVKLPASAFRKKKDGTTYVTPGLLAAPSEWGAIEDWLRHENTTHSDDSLHHLASPDTTHLGSDAHEILSQGHSHHFDTGTLIRHGIFERLQSRMTRRQQVLLEALFHDVEYKDIMEHLHIDVATLKKEVKALHVLVHGCKAFSYKLHLEEPTWVVQELSDQAREEELASAGFDTNRLDSLLDEMPDELPPDEDARFNSDSIEQNLETLMGDLEEWT